MYSPDGIVCISSYNPIARIMLPPEVVPKRFHCQLITIVGSVGCVDNASLILTEENL